MNAVSQNRGKEPLVTHHTVTVQAPIERAFRVFTDGFDRWWPRSHKLGKADLERAVVESRVGGRWYERTVDGAECVWGQVLAWEPPRRAVLSWHIGADWKVDPDPARASEIEVTFVALGAGTTRVDIEHRHLERHGLGAEDIVKSTNSSEGWPGILEAYAKVAAAAVAADG